MPVLVWLCEIICAFNVVGFIVVGRGLFPCLFHFLMEAGFIVSSGPALGLCGGTEPLSGLLRIFLLIGEKC